MPYVYKKSVVYPFDGGSIYDPFGDYVASVDERTAIELLAHLNIMHSVIEGYKALIRIHEELKVN
jgi:hypothetical protein